MAHEVGTVTVKMTDTELQHAIASLEFYTTLNIPIDTEYLVPYDKLKHDLMRIKKQLEDYKHEVITDGKKETVITGKIQQKKYKPCD
tara:strand:+ start:588 stop:848 length:261 start_codon:yes stop_codon:yes gene_type:complete